ncbi:MAG: 1-acyl-sn-glycerol-3-phosphate acyltransferase [Duodenibacillus sp.]|nr:1-acyl-sn-glycerol-3-phosphate acyltransferase [Duodenibacillus sp.]
MFEFSLMMPVTWITRLIVGAYPQWIGCQPAHKQRIYFANHTSHLDTVVLWASLPRVLRGRTRPVAARDYWSHGLFRVRLAKELNVVLVDRRREAHSNPLGPLEDALRAGDSLIIFPEGTRRPQPLPSEFKSGLWRLMREFPDVELIPVYIENLHRAMPKGVLIPVPTVCSVRFGTPLAHDPADLKEDFLARARQAVIDLAELS